MVLLGIVLSKDRERATVLSKEEEIISLPLKIRAFQYQQVRILREIAVAISRVAETSVSAESPISSIHDISPYPCNLVKRME